MDDVTIDWTETTFVRLESDYSCFGGSLHSCPYGTSVRPFESHIAVGRVNVKNRGRPGVNVKDVAALAGVSVATVSNVLNAPDRVVEETRRRVQDAINELGWVRNESARQLRVGRSDTVGIVLVDVANPYFTNVMRGAEELLQTHGIGIAIGDSNQSSDKEKKLIRHFRQTRPLGVLIAPIGKATANVRELADSGVPVVLIDGVGHPDFSGVGADDLEGGRLAADHLFSLGHRRIGLCGGPAGLLQVVERRRGAHLAAEKASGAVIEFDTLTMDLDAGAVVAEQFLRIPTAHRPTALFAGNDLVAIGVSQALMARGIDVPKDVAIIGYDDISFVSAVAPPLSSVSQPCHDMGKAAAQILLDLIQSPDKNTIKHELFLPNLVVRASTTCPKVINP